MKFSDFVQVLNATVIRVAEHEVFNATTTWITDNEALKAVSDWVAENEAFSAISKWIAENEAFNAATTWITDNEALDAISNWVAENQAIDETILWIAENEAFSAISKSVAENEAFNATIFWITENEVFNATINWIAENPKKSVALGVAGVAVAVPMIISGPALAAAGFGADGIAGASLASTVQAGIGNVAADSVFAVLQSAAMGGYGYAIINGAITAGGVVTGVTTGVIAVIENKEWEEPDVKEDENGRKD